ADTLRNQIACRWQELRESTLQTQNLVNFINSNLDYIEEARIRNFQRWPVLGVYVWPNYFVGADYEDEVNYLTDWLLQRLQWMDENMVGECIPVSKNHGELAYNAINVFPNPFDEYVNFSFSDIQIPVQIEIYNTSAVLLKSVEVKNTAVQKIFLGDLNSGLYFYRVISSGAVLSSGKLIKK
ncbi:MAG: T9SS type A sorting domain-containing protein, partial [Bacteroidales bacterium]